MRGVREAQGRMKVVVYHRFYGCETGCCGHTVEVDGEEKFLFEHPYGQDHLEWAKKLVADEYGADHVADLDWENCFVTDSC